MKKLFLSFAFLGLIGLTFGQLIDEKNVTVTMDLQPVLQLHMSTPDQIEFVFDDIKDYYGGIIKYGATVLKVSSSVSWDLYAVGISQGNVGVGMWDNQLVYNGGASTDASDQIPLSALEIFQRLPNAYAVGATAIADYSTTFPIYDPLTNTVAVPGQNSIYHSATPYARPDAGQKYIQGHFTAGATDAAPGGSYLTESGTTSDYYFVLDYRILPGLPAVFPAAGDNAGALEGLVAPAYAQSGVYTMNVKYVLLEDQ